MEGDCDADGHIRTLSVGTPIKTSLTERRPKGLLVRKLKDLKLQKKDLQAPFPQEKSLKVSSALR